MASTDVRRRTRKSIAHVPMSMEPSPFEDVNKENEVQDGAVAGAIGLEHPGAFNNKKSRSKSLGPGGLDALQATSGNRRQSASAAPPKSILKPSIPLSPLKEIPSLKPKPQDNQDSSPRRAKSSSEGRQSPGKSGVVPQSPAQSCNESSSEQSHKRLPESPKGARSDSTSPSRSHPVEQSDPEKGARKKQREEIERQRDMRRKSMANRRVSFAPEATLHTWDVVEYMQDSTTSSASPNSTRGASAFAQSQNATSASARPATPPSQKKPASSLQSPEQQRAAHQKKRRRSSAVPPVNLNDSDNVSSSPFSEVSASEDDDTLHSHQSIEDAESATSSSFSGPQGEDTDYVTLEASVADVGRPDDEESQVDASLEEAAKHAGTKGIEFDENGDVSVELAGDGVTAALQPWVKQSVGIGSPHPRRPHPVPATKSQENFNPFSPAFGAKSNQMNDPSPQGIEDNDDDMSMDITRAIGGIVQPSVSTVQRSPNRITDISERTLAGVGKSSNADLALPEDQTMEFTKAIGGIRRENDDTVETQSINGDEEMSMEFTGIFKPSLEPAKGSETQQKPSRAEDTIQEGQDMELTRAMGGIVSTSKPARDEARSPMRATFASRARQSAAASATGSPSIANSRSRLRSAKSIIPKTTTRPKTPTEQITPQASRPSTPNKTPLSSNVAMRHPSPKKLFEEEIKEMQHSSPKHRLFHELDKEGTPTARFVLAPNGDRSRRQSFMANDQGQSSSPNIAALLDRRRSIGESADVFSPDAAQARGVRFEDPKAIELELAKAQEEEIQRETPQAIIEDEVNADASEEKDATATLKEMMKTMTPKKGNLKGRKSLAVGAAKGLLGKRPIELDEDDEDGSPREYGKASSPVKKIRLQRPASASQSANIFRSALTEIAANGKAMTPTTGIESKPHTASTPKGQGRFKDANALASAQKPIPVLGDQSMAEADAGVVDDKISLQDFLNMTNMRFMDLTMSKRRHKTAGPNEKFPKGEAQSDDDVVNDPNQYFIEAAVAGASKAPMLELYQHACREMKKYKAEGDHVIQEIEAVIAEDEPQIFRDYVSATPAARSDLDAQFRRLKTRARLLSKETWYEWRLMLLNGLMQSLSETEAGLSGDEKLLTAKEEALDLRLPAAIEEQESLQRELAELQEREMEFASSDPDELEEARRELEELEEGVDRMAQELQEHQQEDARMSAAIEEAESKKSQYQVETKEAQRQREECRGWSVEEVRRQRAKVDALESQSGWSIVSASGSTLTLSYLHEVELFFNVATFQSTIESAAHDAPISLKYTGDDSAHHKHPQPLSTSLRFFLQLLQAHLHALPQHSTAPRDLLTLISNGWDRARSVAAEIKRLNLLAGITEARILGDEQLAIETSVLLREVRTKVLVAWNLDAHIHNWDVKLRARAAARVVYGEAFREAKMKEFLTGHVGTGRVAGPGSGAWADAEIALRKGLLGSRRARKIAV